MANGPLLQVGDVTIPEPIFTPYVQELTTQKSGLVQSGALVEDPLITQRMAGGGRLITMPAWNDLDDDAEDLATDDPADIIALSQSGGTPALPASFNDAIPAKVTSKEETIHRLSRQKAWSEADIARELAGSTSMTAVANRAAYYWTRRLQALFIAQWQGISKDNAANDSGDYAHDAAGASFSDGVTNFTAVNAIRASATMGDEINMLALLMVHPDVYTTMREKNLIEFVEDSDAKTRIEFYQNMRVIVDKAMPSGTSVVRGDGSAGVAGMYESWMFGPGTTGLGRGARSVPTAVERQELAGGGAGQTTLVNRVAWGMHPRGHSCELSASTSGPSNAAFNAAAAWNRAVPEREQVKFARLITRES